MVCPISAFDLRANLELNWIILVNQVHTVFGLLLTLQKMQYYLSFHNKGEFGF